MAFEYPPGGQIDYRLLTDATPIRGTTRWDQTPWSAKPSGRKKESSMTRWPFVFLLLTPGASGAQKARDWQTGVVLGSDESSTFAGFTGAETNPPNAVCVMQLPSRAQGLG